MIEEMIWGSRLVIGLILFVVFIVYIRNQKRNR